MSEHVVPRKTYVLVWAILIVFTFSTWGIALIDLGPWNIAVALIIAFIKATLVVLLFMHMKYNPHRTRLVLAAGLFWMAVLMLLTLSDYATRQMPSAMTPPVAVPTQSKF